MTQPDLFDITRPKPGTQCARLLAALEGGMKITPLNSWIELGIPQPARRVHDLKNMGFDITADMITVTNRYGESCRVARYSI